MRKVDEIIIHCSATRAKWMEGHSGAAKVAEIKRWHVNERGWTDIGYHFVIDRDGQVYEGRDVSRPGAHTRGKNQGTIGICLLGGHGSNQNDRFSDHFTSKQDYALRDLLARLKKEHAADRVTGHNQYAPKACPGFRVEAWLRQSPPGGKEKPNLIGTLVKAFALLLGKAK